MLSLVSPVLLLMSNGKLTNENYCEAAKDLGCDVAALMAVAEVESAGGGYDENGRLKLRFEGHKFREYTFGKYDKTHPHLSYPYKFQRNKLHGYSAFNDAFALDEEAALKASSFGKFQPLAVNHREAGFKSVRSFVDFLRISESNQLIVFCLMVKFRGLDDELRRRDWAGFALNYNGRAYRDNDYDGKMRRAYERFKKQRINCNEFADLTEDEIVLDIPQDYSASGDSSQSDAIFAPMSDKNEANELPGSVASDSSASIVPAQQVAENITNVSAGDKPETIISAAQQAAPVVIAAPEPTNFLGKLWKIIVGIFTGTILLPSFLQNGLDFNALLQKILELVNQNFKYILFAAIGGLCVWFVTKKINNFQLTKLVVDTNADVTKRDVKIL